MVIPSLDHYQARVQAHFSHHKGSYCFAGVFSVTSYTIYSKWGKVAVITFAMMGIGIYSYARPKIEQVCKLAYESKLSALFPLVTTLISVAFPYLGIFLGAISSGIQGLKNQQMNEAVNQAEGRVQELCVHNQQLEQLVEDMKLQSKRLEGLIDRCLKMLGKIEEIAEEHSETEKIIQPIEQQASEQMSRLEAKIHQLISIQNLLKRPDQPSNISKQVDKIAGEMEEQQKGMTENQKNLRFLIEQASNQLAAIQSSK